MFQEVKISVSFDKIVFIYFISCRCASLFSVHFQLSTLQKERKAAGLLKLFSGAAAKKKPRSPTSSPPTHDPSLVGQGAVATDPTQNSHHHHHHARSGSCPLSSQGRAGSCPIESEMAGAIGLEPLHRKSGSLDTNFPMSPPATRAGSALMVFRPEPKPLSRERWVFLTQEEYCKDICTILEDTLTKLVKQQHLKGDLR